MFVLLFCVCVASIFSVSVFILLFIGMLSFMPGAEKVHVDIYVCITAVFMFLFLVCVFLPIAFVFVSALYLASVHFAF